MDWCRLTTNYYLDGALLRAGEAAEVLFLRCIAYSGAQETRGLVPKHVLPMLTPAKTQPRLAALLREGLLVDEGDHVRLRSWDRHQERLDAESERRRKDRERKVAERVRRRAEGHEVYRLYDVEDVLLYVGQSDNVHERLRQHAYESRWWSAVSWASLQAAANLEEALEIERVAIAEEHPVHNLSRGNRRPAGWPGHADASCDSSVTRVQDVRAESARIEVEVEVEEDQTEPLPPAVVARSPIAQASFDPSRASTTADLWWDAWWDACPRKVGKRTARTAWDRACRRATPDVLLAGIQRLRDDPNREPAFTPHPATWLNRDGWQDEPCQPRNVRPNRAEERDRRHLALIDHFSPDKQGEIA